MIVTDQLKVIPKFLAERIGKLLVIYPADVLPFRQLLDRKTVMLASKGFLWYKTNKPRKTDDLTKALTQESGRRMGFRIIIADYRHIIVAIDRRHVLRLTDGIDPNKEDGHDLKASHSTTTADKIFGVRGDVLKSLRNRSITIIEKVTMRWHLLLGLISKGRIDSTIGQSKFPVKVSTPPAKRIKTG